MKSRGFTLIEMLMVIMLITIISSIALPKLFSSQMFRENNFPQDFLFLVQYARVLAKTSGCEIMLQQNNEHQIALWWRNECDSGAYDKAVPSPYFYAKKEAYILQLPKNMDFKKYLPLYFTPNFSVNMPIFASFSLIELPLGSKSLYIDKLSGYAYVN